MLVLGDHIQPMTQSGLAARSGLAVEKKSKRAAILGRSVYGVMICIGTRPNQCTLLTCAGGYYSTGRVLNAIDGFHLS